MGDVYKKVKASALCLDIRDFTPTLSENIKNKTDNKFYLFLSSVYQLGVDLASELTQKTNDTFYINSTGDGFICVFFGEDHYFQAYFMGLALINKLKELTDLYEHQITFKSENLYKFGIGIETGEVVKVSTQGKSIIVSYIGDAINLAARIEAKTKEYKDTPMIYGEHINNLLCLALYDTDYDNLANIVNTKRTRRARKALNDDMNYFNDVMISDFLHSHTIKGATFERLYKISISEYTQTQIDKYPLLEEQELPLFYKLFFIKYSNAKDSKDPALFFIYPDLLKSCFCSYLSENYPSIKNPERFYSRATFCLRNNMDTFIIDYLFGKIELKILITQLQSYYLNKFSNYSSATLRSATYIHPIKVLKEFFDYQSTYLF